MTTTRLTRIRVEGFRSLRKAELQLSPVTVLIGSNGSGKSNLLSALRLIPLIRTQSLRQFVGRQGGASALLHYGAKSTPDIDIELEFVSPEQAYCYSVRLGHTAGDAFNFLNENVSYRAAHEKEWARVSLGTSHVESQLVQVADASNQPTVKVVDSLVSRIGFYHFHDTSFESPLRQNSRQADNKYLRSDGSNLASFLHRLKGSNVDGARQSWNLIHGLVRRVAPYIKALSPELVDAERPEHSAIRLYWTDERDHIFDVHDLSDGTLRAIALITALAQPSTNRPSFIAIDEPELGLHPAAIAIVASLVSSISEKCQVLLATQSPALLDYFEPEQVVVAERPGGETSLRRLVPEELAVWLEEYSLSELYDKNLLGGRP